MDTIIDKIIIWKKNAPEIDKIRDIVILDKQTGLPKTADSCVREIEVFAINLKTQLSDKLNDLQQLKTHWNQFDKLKKQAANEVDGTHNQLQSIISNVKHSSDLPGAVELLTNLLDAQVEKSPIKENLRKEALQLMKEDLQNVSIIQNSISEIESKWNKVNEDIKDEKLKLSDIMFAWNEFQEAKDRVVKDIGKIDKSIENLEVPNDVIQCNINCDKTKKALEALKKSKALLDKTDAKGQTIIRKCETIPGIESEVKRDLQIVHDVWGKIYEKILKLVQTTESQASIWKNIEETKITLQQWLVEQSNSLSAAIEKPNELEAAAAKLSKYREELPSHQRLFNSIPTKYEQLINLTNSERIPAMLSLIDILKGQFDEVENTAQKLKAVTSTFGENEKRIRDDIKQLSNTISTIREQIISCEDLSGENSKILERLLTVRTLKQDLISCNGNINIIDSNIAQMRQNYPTFSESSIPNEQQLLKKRYDGIIAHTNKIENSLLTFLKKFHNEKYGALQRIIATHREKIQWCHPEPASDKYNLQVKLNSLEPIKTALEDCQKRKLEIENSLQLLQQIESPESIKLLQAEKDHLFQDLNNLQQDYTQIKEKLERNVAILDNYEKMSEAITSWLKDIENRVKAESTTQIDLNTINEKIAEIKDLQQDVLAYESQIENLIPIGDELLKELPESRVNQFVQHLNTRYKSVTKFLSNYIEKLEELNKYKQLYRNSIADVEKWLEQAEEKVKQFTQIASKPNQATLQELKKFASEKERVNRC